MLESIDFLAFSFPLFFTHVVDWLRLGEVDVNLDGFEDLGSESQLLRAVHELGCVGTLRDVTDRPVFFD